MMMVIIMLLVVNDHTVFVLYFALCVTVKEVLAFQNKTVEDPRLCGLFQHVL